MTPDFVKHMPLDQKVNTFGVDAKSNNKIEHSLKDRPFRIRVKSICQK